MQQIHTDRIDAVMIAGCDETSTVDGKLVPAVCNVDRVKAELRTRQGKPETDFVRTVGMYLCFDAELTCIL